MKKVLIPVLVLMFFIAFGCKNNSPTASNPSATAIPTIAPTATTVPLTFVAQYNYTSFTNITDMAIDSNKNIFINDWLSLNRCVPPTYNYSHWVYGSSISSIDGLATDSGGNIYVADSGSHSIKKFNSSFTLLTQWGSLGSSMGQFSGYMGIATDSSNNVYIADFGNNRVQKFTSGGTYLTSWSCGSYNYHLFDPETIAVDNSGNVFVSNSYGGPIAKYTTNGIFLTSWTCKKTFFNTTVAVRGIAFDTSGNVFVADSSEVLQKYTSNGTFISSWNVGGSSAIAMDSDNKIYLIPYMGTSIKIFTQ